MAWFTADQRSNFPLQSQLQMLHSVQICRVAVHSGVPRSTRSGKIYALSREFTEWSDSTFYRELLLVTTPASSVVSAFIRQLQLPSTLRTVDILSWPIQSCLKNCLMHKHFKNIFLFVFHLLCSPPTATAIYTSRQRYSQYKVRLHHAQLSEKLLEAGSLKVDVVQVTL